MSTEVIEATPPRFVVQTFNFQNNLEQVIQERCIVAGEQPAGICVFIGRGIALLPNPDHPGDTTKMIKRPTVFDLPGATTYHEAFGMFDVYWQRILTQLNAVGSIPKPRPTPFVIQIRELLDNNMRSIQEHVVIEGQLPPKYCRFHGRAAFDIEGQLMEDTFILDGAETVEQAYALYDPICAEVNRRLTAQLAAFKQKLLDDAIEQKCQQDLATLKEARAERANKGKKIILPGSLKKFSPKG